MLDISTEEKRNEAISKLSRLDPDEQMAVLDALSERRKQKKFICYFQPWTEQAQGLKEFRDHIKIFGLLGGNRSGKTVLGAFLAVAWALGKEYFKDEPVWEIVKDLPIPPTPNNIWVVGLDFGLLRDVIWYEKLRHGKNHPPFLPDDGSIKKTSDGDFQVFFNNGSLITGKSADAGREKFQGASIDLVWIDEECSKGVFDECYQRTIDCEGKILLTLTPLTDVNSGTDDPWVFDLYEDWQQGEDTYYFCQLSMLNSPFISQKEKDAAIERWAGDPEEGARLYGKFIRRSGLVYPTWSKKSHIVKAFPIPDWWQRIVSIDPAATGITAAIWIAVNEKGDYFAYKEYYEKDRTVFEHAKAIKIFNGGDTVDYWLLDPYWGRQRNAETHKTGEQLYRESGLPIRLPKFADDFPLHISREYINAAVVENSRLPKFQIFEGELPHFEHEMTHYVWDSFKQGENKGQSKDKPRKKADHLINAWQYACTLRLKGIKRGIGPAAQKHLTDSERVKVTSYT